MECIIANQQFLLIQVREDLEETAAEGPRRERHETSYAAQTDTREQRADESGVIAGAPVAEEGAGPVGRKRSDEHHEVQRLNDRNGLDDITHMCRPTVNRGVAETRKGRSFSSSSSSVSVSPEGIVAGRRGAIEGGRHEAAVSGSCDRCTGAAAASGGFAGEHPGFLSGPGWDDGADTSTEGSELVLGRPEPTSVQWKYSRRLLQT